VCKVTWRWALLFTLPQNSSVVQKMWSPDGGSSWGAPEPDVQMEGAVLSSAPVRDTDGTWLLLVHNLQEGNTLFRAPPGRILQWEAVASVTPGAVMLHQPSLILVGGQLVALFLEKCCAPGEVWTGGVHRSVGSRSSTAAEWSPAVAISTLPRRCRELQAITLATGVVAAVIGHHRSEAEVATYLSIALSSDGGESWEQVRDLSRRYLSGSRPSIAQTPDGGIHITYTHAPASQEGGHYHSIRHVRVTEEWVRSGGR